MKDNLDAFEVYLDQTDGTTLNQTLDYQEQETQLEMRLRTIHFISGRLLLLTPMEIKVVPESIRLERIKSFKR